MHKKEIIAITAFLFLIIAIGLFYFNSPNNITGAAVAGAEKESVFYGTYSIKPSFKVSVDYDADEYADIVNGLKEISKCAKDGAAIETCMKVIEKTMPDYKWELNCDTGAEKVFYDFAEFYQDCFNSEDNGCICRSDFDYSKEEIEKYNLAGKYKISLEEDSNKGIINLKLEEPKIDLEYGINTNKVKNWNPIEYNIEYKPDKKESLNLKFRDELAGKYYDIKDVNELILYKFDDRYKDKKQNEMDFVKIKSNKIIFPNKQEKEISSLRECDIKKNIYKFCVTNKKKSFYVYNKIKNKVEQKNIVIKFAAYLENLPPPPVESIVVYDRPKDGKSLIIAWDKSPADDVSKYAVYIAESGSGIFNKPLSDIKKDKDILIYEYKIKEQVSYKGIFIPTNCEFDYKNKKCMFVTSAVPEGKLNFEIGKLYSFSSLKDNYFVSVSVPEDKEYKVAVVAVDENGNEIDNVKQSQKLPVIEKGSKDDLPIDSKGITSPRVTQNNKNYLFKYDEQREHLNIDGTKADDFFNYKVYYKIYRGLGLDEIAEKQKELLNQNLKQFSSSFEFDPSRGEQIESPEIDWTSGEFIVFAIVAQDKNKNPNPNKFKLNELGIETLRYP